MKEHQSLYIFRTHPDPAGLFGERMGNYALFDNAGTKLIADAPDSFPTIGGMSWQRADLRLCRF